MDTYNLHICNTLKFYGKDYMRWCMESPSPMPDNERPLILADLQPPYGCWLPLDSVSHPACYCGRAGADTLDHSQGKGKVPFGWVIPTSQTCAHSSCLFSDTSRSQFSATCMLVLLNNGSKDYFWSL